MSLSTTSGMTGVPDGLTLFTDNDGCSQGCYLDVGISDTFVVSGTTNEVDFVQQMYRELCRGTNCYSNLQTVWGTEAYYNGTAPNESWWFDAELKGTADGSSAVETYMNVMKDVALGAVASTRRAHDLVPCQDGFIMNGDPDASSGCNPHEKRYGMMSSQVRVRMYDAGKDQKASLDLTFDLKRKESGFCKVLGEILDVISVAPLGDGASTGIGAAGAMAKYACE